MIKTEVKNTAYCDFCGKKLPIIQYHTPFGDIDSIKTYTTKEWNTQEVLPHLCEECALQIDVELRKIKSEILKGYDNNV